MSDRTIDLTTPAPPAGTTFAAVQVEATPDGTTWRVVGAEPTREVVLDPDTGEIIEERLKTVVAAACHLADDDTQIRATWVCEDATREPVITTHDPNAGGRRRRLGGPR